MTSYLPGNSTDLVVDDVTHIEYAISKNLWIVVAPVLLFVGTVGSVLSLLVLCQRSMRQQTTMFYLAVLAILDVAVLYTGLMRFWLENQMDVYIRLQSSVACKLHNAFVYVCFDASVWVTVAVSVDRCIFVSLPHKAKLWCTMTRARRVIGLILVVVSLINCHFLWTYDREKTKGASIAGNNQYQCYAVSDSPAIIRFIERVWPWVDFCKFCLIPFCIMSVTTVIIVRQLVQSDRKMAAHRRMSMQVPKRSSIRPLVDDKSKTTGCVFDNGKTNGIRREDETVTVIEKENSREINHGSGLVLKSETQFSGILKKSRGETEEENHGENIQNNYVRGVDCVKVESLKIVTQPRDGDVTKSPNVALHMMTSQEISSEASTIELQDNALTMTGSPSLCNLTQLQTKKEAFGRPTMNVKSSFNRSVKVLTRIRRHTQVTPYSTDTPVEREVGVEVSDDNKAENHLSATSTTSQRQGKSHFDGDLPTSMITPDYSKEPASSMYGELEVDPQTNLKQHCESKVHCASIASESEIKNVSFECGSVCQAFCHISNIDTGWKMTQLESDTDNDNNNNNNNSSDKPAHTYHNNPCIKCTGLLPNTERLPTETESNHDQTLPICNSFSKIERKIIADHPNGLFKVCCCKPLVEYSAENQLLSTCRLKADPTKINSSLLNMDQAPPITHANIVQTGSTSSHSNEGVTIGRKEEANVKSYTIEHTRNEPVFDTNHDREHKAQYTDTSQPAYNGCIGTHVSGIEANKNHKNATNIDNRTKSHRTTHHNKENSPKHGMPNGNVVTNHRYPSQPVPKIAITRAPHPKETHPSTPQPHDVSTTCLSPEAIPTPTNKRRRTVSTSSTTKLVTSSRTTTTSKLTSRSVYITLVTINSVFWLLNAPIMVYLIGFTYWKDEASDTEMARLTLGWTVVNLLQYTNSAGHFFLYCLTGPRFRQTLGQIFASFIRKLKSFWALCP